MSIHECFPYLRVRHAAAAITFYERAFGSKERIRLIAPTDGRVGPAELELGPFVVMVSDEYAEMGIVGPATVGGVASEVHMHVDDCDAFIARAVEAGAKVVRPPTDAFYGERAGRIEDPFGH